VCIWVQCAWMQQNWMHAPLFSRDESGNHDRNERHGPLFACWGIGQLSTWSRTGYHHGREKGLIRKFETSKPALEHPGADASTETTALNAQESAGAAMDKTRPATMLVVSPNLSMSWKANLVLAGAFAFVCLGLGLIWAWFGLWLVLPFAGAEVLFVTWCLYLTVRRLSVKEVITVCDNEITLEWGMKEPERKVSLPRHWSRLVYHGTESPFWATTWAGMKSVSCTRN